MAAWTRLVVRHRWAVLALWAAVLLAGGYASALLPAILSNVFSVPGTDAEHVRQVVAQQFNERSDGSFTVVFRLRPTTAGAVAPAVRTELTDAVERAAKAVPHGTVGQFALARAPGGDEVVYGDIDSPLGLSRAKGYTPAVLAALGHPRGVAEVYVTGAAAIQHDLDPVFKGDLRSGELELALPVTLLILFLVFGLSVAVTVPLIVAACSICGTLGIVLGVAHLTNTPTYATNLVELIGLGLAVDYSLLMVHRFRDELGSGDASGDHVTGAVVRTMQSAGRAVVFSGAAVALGLALLVAMPLPFIRALGIAGFLIPVVSIAAALTLQPALLSVLGRRGVARVALRRPRLGRTGFWLWLSRAIMARPVLFLSVGTAILVAAAVPALWIQVTPGSSLGIPRTSQSVRGFDLLRRSVGAGAVQPAIVLVEAPTGSVLAPTTQAAITRLASAVRRDPEVAKVVVGSGVEFVTAARRYEQILILGRHDYGLPQEQALVKRLRGELVPEAGFPRSTVVLVGGAPALGVDFLHRTYGAFIPLIAGVLVLTYLLLLRAFRSLLLPLKAVLLNLLSTGASYGMIVVFFRFGLGRELFGLYQFGQVEGWIPVFLFAVLFGLSMDYEVFLVARIREAWDSGADNASAVALGLERTGRVITAAAVVMCAASSGFIAGRIVGLQEFGLGLAVAIFLDATIIRCLLVPSLMAVLGRWNWWLPEGPARLLRVAPSPVGSARMPVGQMTGEQQ